MGFIPLDIPPGVVKTKSGEGAVGRWIDANNVRFVAGKPRKRAGFVRLNPTTMLGKARGMKAWNKINGLGLYAVGTHLKLYGSVDGVDVVNITPLRPVYQWAASLSSTLNLGAISVHMTGHGYSVGQLFLIYGNSYKGGSQIAGVVLNGTWAVVSVTDANNFVIYQTSAQGTLGGTPFATTNTSTTVTVTHPTHGRKTGDTVWFSGSTAVGGITIAGDYQITVINGNSYTIVHSAAATSTATGGGAPSYKFSLPANATVALGGGTVPYNIYLTNPITTTNASTSVTIAHTAHGAKAGDTVNITGATAVGGITINGDYVIVSVSTNTYVITHSAAATSGATGGGTAVVATYEISSGPQDKITSHRGFGQGPLGAGPFGTSTPVDNSTYFDPRTWAIDHIGQDGMMCPLSGQIYYWVSNAGTRAEAIPEAPINLRYAFMTDERHLTALGANGDPMVIAWASQDNIGDWVVSEINTANSGRRVSSGSTLVAGCPVGGGLNLIWTDTTAYIHQYTGGKYIYDTRIAGPEAGLIGPQAFAKTPKGVMWMSQTRFKMFNGYVLDVPKAEEIQTWVYNRLDPNQLSKAFAIYDAVNNSVDFYYVPTGGSEPTDFVTVSLDDYSWVPGIETRSTGGAFQKGHANPLKVLDGVVYRHEVGTDANGAAAPSSLTLAPYQVQEEWSEFLGFDPNFKSRTGSLQLTLTSYDHDEDDIVDTETETITSSDLVDFRSSGRHIGLTISQTVLGGDWALDTPKIDIKAPRGRKR